MSKSTIVDDFCFTKITLANGLDVIVRDQHQLPMVAINLWYHVGSKNEERNQRGFAHLFEHLMFEGSLHYPGDFFKYLQRLGANINGSTSSDRTNYFVDLPTAHAELALAMESDRMAHLLGAVDQGKLDVQRDVVKNEYRQNYANRPYGMVWPLLAEALYPRGHPYSWMTIGVMEDLDRATIDDVSSFFRRYYVPSNASLALVGDIDPDRAVALAERYFGPIGGGSAAALPWAPEHRLSEDIRIVLRDRVELDRLYLIWPSVPHFHADDAALLLLGDVLGRGRASRLYRKLVIDEQIAQDVTVYQSGRELAGSFGVIVTLRPSESLDRAIALVDAELGGIAASGVNPDELARVQRQRSASFFYALEHMGGFGGVADRLNLYNVHRGDPSLVIRDAGRFEAVSPTELDRAAATYLSDKPRIALRVLGNKKPATMPPLDRGSVPGSLAPARYRPPLPVVMALDCGIPLWVFPRSDLPTVAGSIVMKGGASHQRSGQAGLCEFTVDMLEEGTTSKTAAQIALDVESLGASVAASSGWDAAYVSFKCLSDDLPRVLDLAADILLNPSFPDAEWTRVRGQTLAALQSERDSAEARGYRALLTALYPTEHPYSVPMVGTDASVRGLTRADLAVFHGNFLVPSHAAIVVAGDVVPEALADALNARLAPWHGPAVTLPSLINPPRTARVRVLLLDRPGAAQAVLRAGYVGIARNDPAYERAVILNHVLGSQFSSRLNTKLREERGLTYGVRSQFDCRRSAGPFSISAAVQTSKVAEALDEVRRELLALIDDRPPTQAELDDARRSLIEGQTRLFDTTSALVNRFASLVVHDLPVDYDAGFPDRVAAIDVDLLATTARALLQPNSLVCVVVADANEVRDSLNRLEWANLEIITD
jgi:zinc protease